MSVTVYKTKTCSFCRRAEDLLRQHGVPFEVVDVTEDRETREALVERAHGRRTVPVIFHDDEVIGGYAELVAIAARRGLGHLVRTSDLPVVTRGAGRLLIVDPAGRLLLFRHAEPSGRSFWATPGGGAERGESLEAAAAREAIEELGARGAGLSWAWTGRTMYSSGGRRIDQTEAFFFLNGAVRLNDPIAVANRRRENIIDVKWWSLEEIERSAEDVFPVDLVSAMREHLPRLSEATA